MEKDARARRDGKKKGGGLGKSGGLARLGLKIEAKEGAVGAKVPVQKQVDSFLANMGVDVDYVAAESQRESVTFGSLRDDASAILGLDPRGQVFAHASASWRAPPA